MLSLSLVHLSDCANAGLFTSCVYEFLRLVPTPEALPKIRLGGQYYVSYLE